MKRKEREKALGKVLTAWQVDMATGGFEDVEDAMNRGLSEKERLDLDDLASRSLLLPDGSWDFRDLDEEELERFHRLVLEVREK